MVDCYRGAHVTSHAPRVTRSSGARLSSSEERERHSPVAVPLGSSRVEHADEGRSPGVGPTLVQPENAWSPPASRIEDVASLGMHLSLVICTISPFLSHVVSCFSCISLEASSNPPVNKLAAAMAEIPRPLSDSSPLVAMKESLSISNESLVRYNLRNQSIHIWVEKGGMGLGLISPASSPKKRDRKSHLSLEKEHARLDVVVGRQSSIIQALRAIDAQDGLLP